MCLALFNQEVAPQAQFESQPEFHASDAINGSDLGTYFDFEKFDSHFNSSTLIQVSTAGSTTTPSVKYKECPGCSRRKKRCPLHVSLKKVKPSPEVDAMQASTTSFITIPSVKYKECPDCTRR